MITKTEADEILRLARMKAMKSVRHFAARRGVAGPGETLALTETQSLKAQDELQQYVTSLIKPENTTQFEDSYGVK